MANAETGEATAGVKVAVEVAGEWGDWAASRRMVGARTTTGREEVDALKTVSRR